MEQSDITTLVAAITAVYVAIKDVIKIFRKRKGVK